MRSFPDLFCFGHVNFDCGIKVLKTFKECGKALYRNKSHHFRQSSAFVDAFYRIVQDTEIVAAADDLRQPVMPSTISKWSRLTVPDIVQAAEDKVQGIGYSNLEFHQIIYHVIGMLKMFQGNVFSTTRLRDMPDVVQDHHLVTAFLTVMYHDICGQRAHIGCYDGS
jgi:hypothetical protein